jgi:hypothetical protein
VGGDAIKKEKLRRAGEQYPPQFGLQRCERLPEASVQEVLEREPPADGAVVDGMGEGRVALVKSVRIERREIQVRKDRGLGSEAARYDLTGRGAPSGR